MPARGAGEGASRCGASILVRGGVGVEVGVLEKKVPERATVAMMFSADASLKITSAHFPVKANLTAELLGTLLGASGPLVVAPGVNSHHDLWEPPLPGYAEGA
ncbi:hypothetical protein TRVL_05797 [Trypanosoma vivax]|nr:hypothetical protein TRVL_05797 [Trypanosoma vivax]